MKKINWRWALLPIALPIAIAGLMVFATGSATKALGLLLCFDPKGAWHEIKNTIGI